MSTNILGSIAKIDNALCNYYTLMNRTDYFDDDGIGKFEKFCISNAFEDDDIPQELDVEIDDCLLIEFDDNFPLHHISNNQDRKNQIFSIIKYCHQHGKVPIQFTNMDDIQYKEKEKQKYKS